MYGLLTTFADYQDIQMRDPEDRPPGITIGAGRAILSNRISHFLNIKGARYHIYVLISWEPTDLLIA